MNVIALSRSLGWLSVGLGVTKLVGGRRLAEMLGMTGRTGLIRMFGLRGVAIGSAILANPASAPLLWTRVAGDALDAAVLAGTPSYGPRQRANVKLALAGLAGLALLDLLCASRLSTDNDEERGYLPPYWED